MAMGTSLFFFFLVFSAPLFSCANDSHPEIDTRTTFKLNLHDPLGALTLWDPSTPVAPCDLRGVGCTNHCITEISLLRLQLSGQVSNRISGLCMLHKLSLRSNSFNGTIPPSLGYCTRLLVVFLQYNSLTRETTSGDGESQAKLVALSLLDLVLCSDSEAMDSVKGDLFKRHSDYIIVVKEIGMKLDFVLAPYEKDLDFLFFPFFV